MGAIFTPGLTVTENHIVQKDRRLPIEKSYPCPAQTHLLAPAVQN